MKFPTRLRVILILTKSPQWPWSTRSNIQMHSPVPSMYNSTRETKWSEQGPVGGKYGKLICQTFTLLNCRFLLRIPRHLPPPPPASLEDALVCLYSSGSTLCSGLSQEIPLTKASLFSMLTYAWVSPLMVHNKILQILLRVQLIWANRFLVIKELCKQQIYGK